MIEARQHVPAVEIPPYLKLKRSALAAGWFSCSQAGFNLAFGPLTQLRHQISEWLACLATEAEHWTVPPLLRSDWVEYGVWNNPPEDEWCREEPGGHLLTPRPLMHLLNRLKHHPQDQGHWLLEGWCTRAEDPELTLPLLRQRTFTMLEHVRLGEPEQALAWAQSFLELTWHAAVGWDLPVSLQPVANGRTGDLWRLYLNLPEVPPVALTTAWLAPAPLLAAYRQEWVELATLGFGLERWCLALTARWGIDQAGWPEIS